MLKKINETGCICMHVLGVKQAFDYLKEEVVELREELSDVAFATGRLLGALTGRLYIRVPFDGLALNKMLARAKNTGCIRSTRHRAHGKCASKEA